MKVIVESSSAFLFWIVSNLVQNSARKRIVVYGPTRTLTSLTLTLLSHLKACLTGWVEDQMQLVLKYALTFPFPWNLFAYYNARRVLFLVKRRVWINRESRKAGGNSIVSYLYPSLLLDLNFYSQRHEGLKSLFKKIASLWAKHSCFGF